jgi:hypothetical protein
MEEITGYWRRLSNEERHIFFLLNIIGVIKSRRIIWTGYLERLGENYAQEKDGMTQIG